MVSKKKINHFFEKINTSQKIKKEFNNKVARYSLLASLYHKDNYVGKRIAEKKEEIIKEYLFNCTKDIQEKYEEANYKNEAITPNSKIWIFWWDGFTNAPEIIKICCKSIIKNSKEHETILLDKNNYQNYINLPKYIISKFENGKMNCINFSDVLRVSLLAEHGGIWLDATIYMHMCFDENIYTYSFCSNKRKNQPTSNLFPAHCRWGTYYLASGKNNILMYYVRDVLYDFWKKHDLTIDYYMIDFIIALGYETNEKIAKQIDKAPFSNEHIHLLLPIINQPFENDIFDKFENTNIFKLSYKRNLKKHVNGKKTVYGYLVDCYQNTTPAST